MNVLEQIGRAGVPPGTLALRHLEGDFGRAWREPFARGYGIADTDESKLA